ncbi:MAG TPA: 30S ribosomal protein S9 [bacterium]
MTPDITKYYGTGRRKTAIARVWLTPGKAAFIVNGLALEKYFPMEALRLVINQPFAVTQTEKKFGVIANIHGGGKAGQAEALRHGITRALIDYSLELRSALKKAGFVTRDPRKKERKKYGQKGARKRFQWTKR